MGDRKGKAPRHEPSRPLEIEWSAGWESQERANLQASLAATPAQRLEWLEEALEIALASGALPDESLPR